MGGGVGSVQSSIEGMLGKATREIQIAVYEITDYDGFLQLLRSCLARGVHVIFCPDRVTEDLHAKVIVVDHNAALVGSANMTWKGLVGNHELAVLVSGEVASRVGMLLDKLREDPRVFAVK